MQALRLEKEERPCVGVMEGLEHVTVTIEISAYCGTLR